MSDSEITVYGAHWCPDCHQSKQFLGEHQIPYHWIDIEEHAEGERFFVSDDHLSLTKNRNFQDDLLHILLDRPPSWER